MTQSMIDRARMHYAVHAGNVGSAAEFGVILHAAIQRSAATFRIPSEDGSSLSVPISIEVSQEESPQGVLIQNCTSSCWTVLGHDVICRKSCVVIEGSTSARHSHVSDHDLRAKLKPGVETETVRRTADAIAASVMVASSASDMGVLVMHALHRMLADKTIPLDEDGSATVDAVAKISVQYAFQDAARLIVARKCTRTCITVFNYEVSCHEVCEDVLQTDTQ